MALSWHGICQFSQAVLYLQSFPVFCAYLLLIPLSKIWHHKTKPLNLKWVMVVYNFTCSGASLYTFVGFIYGLYKADFIYQKSPTPELQQFFFLYWFLKHVELLDTIFMILRHKHRQLSFLHVYHHASMLLLSDYSYHSAAWPAIAVILALNSFVHVMLYFYYGLTAQNPMRQISWKKQLTEMQILQFFVDFVYAVRGYTHHGFCLYGIFYGLVMIGLFSNFYYMAYIKVRPRLKVVAKEGVVENGDKAEYVNCNGKQD